MKKRLLTLGVIPFILSSSELIVYKKRFENLTGVSTQEVTIKFQKLPRSVAGLCHEKSKTVLLNKDTFYKHKPHVREWIVLHELGHCVLGMPHISHVKLMSRKVDNNISKKEYKKIRQQFKGYVQFILSI